MKKILARFGMAAGMLVFVFPAVAANGAQERLDRFFSGLDTMRAEFVQALVDADGRQLEESEGVLLLDRPGKFRLDYYTPYEQLYVADGQRVWMYDPELEQVTVREQESALGSTPALLLSDTEALENAFGVKELGEHAGLSWLELTPKREESTFQFVRLALEGDVLRAMEMVDGFGQTTRIYFRNLERNPAIPEQQFRFEPPEGVDVIGEAS